MDHNILKELNNHRANRQAVILLKDMVNQANRLILENAIPEGELGTIVAKAFASGKSAMHQIAGNDYFLNVYLPATRLVVIGAVHISQHLAQIAASTGFDLEIIDPRTAFATVERFENTRLFAQWPNEVLAQKPLDPYCALIAVTHDPKIDDFPIRAALEANCFYVGALGSRKTHAKRVERLLEDGLSETQLGRIHAPIGLDIAAANPAEIAVAILAQIIEQFRRRNVE